MEQFNFNPKLVLLTQRLIKEELGTPIAIGEISNSNPQHIGCVMPISDEQALVVLDDGSISTIQPSPLSPGSKQKFTERYANISKDPIVFENSERVQHILYFGLGADLDVVLRNDRVSDSEKIKNLISLAAQKVYENKQFREKVKEDSINFLLEKFKMDNSQPVGTSLTEEPIASVIVPKVDDRNDDEINISELAKQHSEEVFRSINQQPSVLSAPTANLPPLGSI